MCGDVCLFLITVFGSHEVSKPLASLEVLFCIKTQVGGSLCFRFYDKTRNDWHSRDSFTKMPGKYDMVHLDYSAKVMTHYYNFITIIFIEASHAGRCDMVHRRFSATIVSHYYHSIFLFQ